MAVQHNFDILFYANPQPMWVFNVNTLQILEVNEAAIKRYGYTRDEFLSKTIIDLRPPEDIALLNNVLHTIRGTNINRLEFRHLTKSGDMLYVEIISYATIYQGAKARIVYACNVDAKRELAGKLKLTEGRLSQILETTVIGFLQLDFDWNITYWNKAAETLIGYPREQVLGKNIWQVLPEIWHSDFRASFEQSMLERKSVDFEDYFWPLQKWLTCNAYPSADGLIVHFRDITHKKLIRESLLEKIDQLKEVSYLNSHTLRKPIASLLGLTQLIKQQLIDPEEFTTIAGLINECSLELDDVVVQVNRMATNEDYLQPLDMVIELFNFKESLTQLTEKLCSHYHKHQVVLTDAPNLYFYGNWQSIEQALKNLVDNAVKFSPAGSKVIINAQVIDQNVVLSVEDFGVGMDELELHRLFIHINQVKHVNLGLGLPKINEVCRRHNGNMWIESQPGKGSVFYMRFPLSNISVLKATGETDFSVFRNPAIHIAYNETYHYITANWSGFHNKYTVRDCCNHLLSAIDQYQCNKLLNDNSQVVGGWMDACDWLVDECFPALEQVGVKRLAWITSPSTFSRLSTTYTIDKVDGEVDIQVFAGKEAAHEWLTSL
jgi:PAS domain S-box-containing protein